MILSPKADSYELTYSAWQKAMSEQHDKKKAPHWGRGGKKSQFRIVYQRQPPGRIFFDGNSFLFYV